MSSVVLDRERERERKKKTDARRETEMYGVVLIFFFFFEGQVQSIGVIYLGIEGKKKNRLCTIDDCARRQEGWSVGFFFFSPLCYLLT